MRRENSEFLLFWSGCGTFCWYYQVYSLSPGGPHDVPDYQRVERPLAFDSKRNLIAYYHSQNMIHVKNLITGYEQAVRTEYDCDYYSGLCFTDVRFSGDKLEYTWRELPVGKKLSALLDSELLKR